MAAGVSAAQALADLQSAVANLQSQVTALASAEQTLNNAVDALKAQLDALKAGSGVDAAAVEDVVNQLQAVASSIGNVTQSVTAESSSITP